MRSDPQPEQDERAKERERQAKILAKRKRH